MTRRFERIYADGDHATIARITKEVVASIVTNACPVDQEMIAGLVARVIHELGKEDNTLFTATGNGVRKYTEYTEPIETSDSTGDKP